MIKDVLLATIFASFSLEVPIPKTMPVVIQKDHCEIQESVSYKCLEGPQVLGYFHPGTGEVVISDLLEQGTPVFSSVLVHEVTHFLQFRRGDFHEGRSSCMMEQEAYMISYMYLEKYYEGDPLELMGLSEEAWDQVFSCDPLFTQSKELKP